MYTVSKGPSKIVAKTRRGVSQNFDRLENSRENTRKPADVDNNDVITSVPKPIFHNISKRATQIHREQDVISPQHEEIIRYIHDSWSTVCLQYRRHYAVPKEPANNNVQSIVYYNDGERSPVLQDFKPFDLESWWGKRIFNSITKSL